MKTKFLQAGKDMCTILEWANTQDVAIKDAGSIRLAQRVFDENYERDEQGEYQQTRAQPTGAVHNPHEPQAQWSSSPPSRTKPGWATKHRWRRRYRRNPGRPGGTDSKLPHRHRHTKCVGERQARYGHSPFGASQHGLGAAPGPVCRWCVRVRAVVCEAQEDFRELHGPAPASPDRGKVFTVEAFDIKVEERRRSVRPGRPVVTVVGCARKRPARWIIDSNGTAPLWRMSKKGGVHRRHADPPYAGRRRISHLVAGPPQEMLTEAFKLDMHHRNGIEGTQSELIAVMVFATPATAAWPKNTSAKLSHRSGVQPSAVVPKGSMGSGTDSLCPGTDTGRRNRRNTMNQTCPHENGERSRPVK